MWYKAENSSTYTLSKFHEERKGLRSMGSNADPIYDPKTAKKSGGTSRQIGWGVRHTSWNPYPISDQNLWFSPPYVRPYKTFLKRKCFYRQMLKKKIILLKHIPNSRLECTNHTLFQTKMVEIDTLFQTKTAEKPDWVLTRLACGHPGRVLLNVTFFFPNEQWVWVEGQAYKLAA